MIQNWAQQAVAELEADFPKWHVWWVPHAVGPVLTWHAHRRGDERHVLHADSPDEPADAIEQEGNRWEGAGATTTGGPPRRTATRRGPAGADARGPPTDA